MNKWGLPLITGFSLLVAALMTGMFWAGYKYGLDSTHQICYTVGGWIVSRDGQVIECRPITQLSKEETLLFNKE